MVCVRASRSASLHQSVANPYLVDIKEARIEERQQFVEFQRQQRFFVLSEQYYAEAENRFDAVRQAAVVYSKDDLLWEATAYERTFHLGTILWITGN